MFIEKQSCDELKGEWNMHNADDLVVCLVDFNGYVGRYIYIYRYIDGFDEVHGGYCLSHTNLEGRMFMEFCLKIELCVCRVHKF